MDGTAALFVAALLLLFAGAAIWGLYHGRRRLEGTLEDLSEAEADAAADIQGVSRQIEELNKWLRADTLDVPAHEQSMVPPVTERHSALWRDVEPPVGRLIFAWSHRFPHARFFPPVTAAHFHSAQHSEAYFRDRVVDAAKVGAISHDTSEALLEWAEATPSPRRYWGTSDRDEATLIAFAQSALLGAKSIDLISYSAFMGLYEGMRHLDSESERQSLREA